MSVPHEPVCAVYDGFVANIGDHLYFLFEERRASPSRKDLVTIITDLGSEQDRDMYIRGQYLTVNQDRPNIPVARPIAMKRVSFDGDYPTDADIAKVLHHELRIVDEVDRELAELILRNG